MPFEVVLVDGTVHGFVEKQKLWKLQLSNMTIHVMPKFNYERFLAELFCSHITCLATKNQSGDFSWLEKRKQTVICV